MPVVRFRVAGKPVAKGRPRVTRNGAFTPAHTRKYEQLVALHAQQAMEGRPLIEEAVALTITVFLPIPQSWSKRKKREAEMGLIAPITRPDVDNYAKLIGDALNGIVWRDDSQIAELRVSKRFALAPAVEIEVAPLSAVEPELLAPRADVPSELALT